jgi:uncharacterized repeat protein (TIGR04044 family)
MSEAHRHLGVLPAFPFYGGPPVTPDTTARASVAELLADLDREGTQRSLVLPNYGVPDPDVSFRLNELTLEAAVDERIRAGRWVSPRPSDEDRTVKALDLADEPGVAALKLSFLPAAGRATARDARCSTASSASPKPVTWSFTCTRRRVAHLTSTRWANSSTGMPSGSPSTRPPGWRGQRAHQAGRLPVLRPDDAGRRVYTDTSWAVGFAPRWLAAEIERSGVGHDRVLFASDEPWGDHTGESARPRIPPHPSTRSTDDAKTPAGRAPGEHLSGKDTPVTETLTELEKKSLVEIPHPSLPTGSNLYGATKVFPDYQAEDGEVYFTLVHGIAHESSVSFVAILQATRALRKGFESAIYFYGPGSLNCLATRGFPTTGSAAFPGEMNINESLKTFIAEGGKVFCCRFGLSRHGAREEDLVDGVIPTHPLDVQDALIHYKRKGAIINSTYMF